MAWSAISGPCTMRLLVKMMLLSRRSLPPDMNSEFSTPALNTCTHFRFLAARTCSGVMLPTKPSASGISCITVSRVARTTLASGVTLCSSFTRAASFITTIFFGCAHRPTPHAKETSISRYMPSTIQRAKAVCAPSPRAEIRLLLDEQRDRHAESDDDDDAPHPGAADPPCPPPATPA